MIDKALESLDQHNKIIESYLDNHYSEADTRVKFIDPLLTNILGWDEFLHIKREENYRTNEDKRCIDYLLSLTEPVLVVEAKKNLKNFEIPTKLKLIKFSLSGIIKDWKNAWDAICQVQAYCVHKGARYALVTNGHQYIAFKAVNEKGSWTKGHALVLRSPEILREHFTLFYECLSRETIEEDRLTDVAFPREGPLQRKKPRTFIRINNSGYRNELFPVLGTAFRDILVDVPQNDPTFLRECYCSSEDAMRYKGQMNSILVDQLPIFTSPVHEVRPGHRKDAFSRAVEEREIVSSGRPLFVIMGGTGVGKTSFLEWYFLSAINEDIKKDIVTVFCDYRGIDCTTEELHARTLKMVIDQLISKTEQYTTNYNQLCEIFRKRINRELRGALKPFDKDPAEKEKRISELLQAYQDYSLEHLDAIVSYLKEKKNLQVIVILDNMDQKSNELQNKLYQIGNEFVYGSNLMAVISLRESTYRRMINTPNFNAFATREFHVKAQPINLIIEKRLSFLEKRLSAKKVTLHYSSGEITVQGFYLFVQLIRRSLLSETAEPQILECLTSMSNGDIRAQLIMFYLFLISGQTKIDEYFWDYAIKKDSFIPFHEFLHSLLLADHKFFDEGLGHRFMNIFEPAPRTNSSHFTCLRLLAYLQTGLGQKGELKGTDFVTIDDLWSEFMDYGISKDEISFHLFRLSKYGLVMSESGDPSDLFRDQPYALTKCGVYYLETLYAKFNYFSSMACDTNIVDHIVVDSIVQILRDSIKHPKLPLINRLKMGEVFIDYLKSKEIAELKGSIHNHPVVGRMRFVPRMVKAFKKVSKRSSTMSS